MPGPGARRKKKAKAASTSEPQPEITNVFLPQIANAEGWNIVVNILCDYFELPG